MDYIISECSQNGSTYAWARNTFWLWDKNVKKWVESGFARELFEKAKAKDPILTETDYFTFSDEFVGVDDWEVSTEMLAALEQATKGEMAPGEEVSADEVSTSSVAAVAAPPSPQGEGLAAFDYSGLSEKTVATLHVAEKMIKDARKLYILDVADAVGLAHDELVSNCDKRGNQYSEDTFRKWCHSLGISHATAYRLLQVSELFFQSTPNEQKVLEQVSPSLLYAAAKPSAPAELVQQVKDGDIKTHKEFREMEAAWKAAEKRADDLKAELTSRDADVSRLAADAEKAERERDAAISREKGALKREEFACGKMQEYREKFNAAAKKIDEQEDQLEELQDLYDDARNRANDLQAELNAAPAALVEAVMADPEEIDRRVQEKVNAWVEAEEAKWDELVQNQQQKISRLEKESGMAGHIRAMTRMVDSLLDGLLDDVLHEEAPDLHIVNAANDLYKALDYWCDRFFEFVEGDTRHDDDDE